MTLSTAAVLAGACASSRVLEGRVVARDARYGIMALATHPQDRVLFMRVERGGHPRFVKLAYQWFDSRDALPEAIGGTRVPSGASTYAVTEVATSPSGRYSHSEWRTRTRCDGRCHRVVQYLQGAPSERIPDARARLSAIGSLKAGGEAMAEREVAEQALAPDGPRRQNRRGPQVKRSVLRM